MDGWMDRDKCRDEWRDGMMRGQIDGARDE